MKKFYAILCLAIASLTQLQAQAPQGFNYQATVRNSAGDLVVNTNVYFKFNVIQGSQTAVPIFTETHYVPTDDLGQVNSRYRTRHRQYRHLLRTGLVFRELLLRYRA